MPHSLTFIDIATRWLSEFAGNVSPKTVEHYRRFLEYYIYPSLGESLEITEEDVKKLLEKKRTEGFSEGTVYAIPKLIWRILSFASAEGLCKAPEWDFVMGRPEKMNPTVILTPEQERRLLDYLTENPTPKNLGIYLILTAGISVGEVLALTWADVSFTLKRIRVLMEKEYAPETRKKFRDVPINERQRIYMMKLASLPTVYVANGKPKPVLRSTLRISFLNALKEVGLPEMTLSDLRRTYAVRCLEGGMSYDRLGKVLGRKNDRSFRTEFDALVSEPTRLRLEQETIAARTPRQAPEHTDNIGPDITPEVAALRLKVEAKKKQLNQALAALDGDLEIVHALRKSNLSGLGRPREGLYQFIEKVLGDDRDGKMLVEYLRCNMRVAAMPSQKDVCVQTIRTRIARGFAKLTERLDAIYEVEGFNILDMFHELTSKIQEIAPPAPRKSGPKPKPTLENEFKRAMEALGRIREAGRNGH